MVDNDKLLNAVEKELTKRSWRLRFDPSVETRFEADTHRQRSRNMVVAGLISACIYILFLLNDYSFRPDAFTIALVLRAGVMLSIGLPILWWVYRGVSPLLREVLMSITVITAMVISCIIFAASNTPYSYLDVFSFGLILVVGNVVYSLRFGYALASSLLSVVIMVYFVSVYEPMPMEVKRLAIFTLCAKAVFTLIANYRLEHSERVSYLLLLKEKCRAGDMIRNNAALEKLSLTDPLTDLANRRQFDHVFKHYWSQAANRDFPLGLMVIDIDHFKAYNDFYGHLQGDQCLRQVAATLQANSRHSDKVVRFGGEEFVVLMTDVDEHHICQAAERLRLSIEVLGIPHEGRSKTDCLTVSIGAALIQPTEALEPLQLFSSADQALYEAKRRGRNCCHVVMPLS